MRRFLGNILVGFLALYLASLLIPGVKVQGNFEEQIRTLFLAGIFLGLINFFIKPVVNLITFPLRLITFGLFSIVVNMAMVWLVDIFFPELIIEGLWGLFWTALIISILSLFFVRRRQPKLREEGE